MNRKLPEIVDEGKGFNIRKRENIYDWKEDIQAVRLLISKTDVDLESHFKSPPKTSSKLNVQPPTFTVREPREVAEPFK